MKKALWCLASAAITGGALYVYARYVDAGIDLMLLSPLVFIVVYLLGLFAYSWRGPRVPRAPLIYLFEALLIALLSLGLGKVLELREACLWVAALLVVAAPSARTVMRFAARAQSEGEE